MILQRLMASGGNVISFISPKELGSLTNALGFNLPPGTQAMIGELDDYQKLALGVPTTLVNRGMLMQALWAALNNAGNLRDGNLLPGDDGKILGQHLDPLESDVVIEELVKALIDSVAEQRRDAVQ